LQLESSKIPAVPVKPVATKPMHPPIALMLKENCKEVAAAAAEAREREWKSSKDSSSIPAVYRPYT
jgi:hypothetical protein